jgi:hypothetical protein
MAPYVAPNLLGLFTAVSRDLRDEANKTFTKPMVIDLINEGIAELNRIRPIEQVVELDPADWPYFSVNLDNVFLVEWQNEEAYPFQTVPEGDRGDTGTQGGWDFFGGVLYMPGAMTPPALTAGVRAWGYGTREPLLADADQAGFQDASDEQAVRAYARYTAAEMLLHERALFGQWQTQSNNTDVSPTQMLQITSTLQQEWGDLRKRLTRLRRV